MKDLNFTPVSVHDTDAQALGEAFSAEPDPSPTARPTAEPETGPWMQTSIKMRKGTRRAVKLHALEHGIHMQEVIDIALRNYLNSNEVLKYRSTEVPMAPGRRVGKKSGFFSLGPVFPPIRASLEKN